MRIDEKRREDQTDDVIPPKLTEMRPTISPRVSKGTDVRKYQVDAEEVDAADVSDKESRRSEERGEQFLEVHKALEIPMEDVETIPRKRSSRGGQFWKLDLQPQIPASRGREFSAWVSREQKRIHEGSGKRGDIKPREWVRDYPCDRLGGAC